MIDEEMIIKNVIDGDVESFRLLVERYQKPVMRMIGNIVNDSHICEDIAQDVFFTAYKKLTAFDNAQSRFSTWLFTIARNKSLNAIKKKKPAAMEDDTEIAAPQNPDNLQQQEFLDELNRRLHSLPRKLKTVFIFAEFEKLPLEQIAQIEKVKITTVRTRLHRAKRKLAKALGLDWKI